MAVSKTRPAPVRRHVEREKIVSFSAERVAAPFVLRVGAAAIDYLLIVACPVLFLLLGRLFGNDGSALLNSELNNIGWLLGILIALTNSIALPVISGRTAGKLLTGLTIVDHAGHQPSMRAMLIRQTVGLALLVLTLGLGFFIAAITPTGRGLHDYVSGTIVIFGEKVRRG